MTIKGKAYIAGAFEHPTRKKEGISLAQLHAECARSGMPSLIEAVRQVRGEAHPAVQAPDCDVVLAHCGGLYISPCGASTTMILERVT